MKPELSDLVEMSKQKNANIEELFRIAYERGSVSGYAFCKKQIIKMITTSTRKQQAKQSRTIGTN